jgi:hypothetical protein
VPDTSRLLVYQDTFLVTGSRGRHRVLVLPLQGPNLRDHAREKPIAARMLAAKQLLQALKALHDGGIIHRGKLSQASLLSIWIPDSLIEPHIADILYRPK